MAGVSLRNSPFSPFSERAGVSEILHSPFRGEEKNGGVSGEAVVADLFGLEQQPRRCCCSARLGAGKSPGGEGQTKGGSRCPLIAC